MRYGSVCSGVEAASLAWMPLGWECKFVSEIEPFPCAVLQQRFGASAPINVLDPNEENISEDDRKMRLSWLKQYNQLNKKGVILNEGDFTKIGKKYAGQIDLLVGGTPCFVAGTMVLTPSGYVPIESLKVGDTVISGEGIERKVEAIGNKISDIGSLKILGRPEISCTDNHPIYCIDVKRDNRRKSPTYSQIIPVGDYHKVPAGKAVGRYVGRVKIAPVTAPLLPEVYSANAEEIMELAGWYLGDGYIRRWSNSNKKAVILALCNQQKINKFNENFAGVINYSIGKDGKVTIACTALADWLSEQFGELSENKRIPYWCYSDKNKHTLLYGYRNADGCEQEGQYKFTTVSKALAYGMADLMGDASVTFTKTPDTAVIEGRTINQKDCYCVHFYKNSTVRTKYFNGRYASKVRKFTYDGIDTVYNITVAEDHTYIANGIYVANCQDLSIAGKRAGFDGERSSLAIDFVRLAYESQCKWFIWENVPGVFSSNHGRDFATLLSLFTGCKVEVPKDGFRSAGFVRNCRRDRYGVAWRVLDAQFTRVPGFPFGVPQRRRRVFVVGYFGDWRSAAEVLLEPSRLQWNTPSRIKARERFAGFIGQDLALASGELCKSATDGGEVLEQGSVNGLDCYNQALTDEVSMTVTSKRADPHHVPCAVQSLRMRAGKEGGGKGALIQTELSGTLFTGNAQAIATFWNGRDVAESLTCTSDRQLMPDKARLQCVISSTDTFHLNSAEDGSCLTLKARDFKDPQIVCLNDQGGSVMAVEENGNAGTLRANTHGNEQIVCFSPGIAPKDGTASRFNGEVAMTLRKEMGNDFPAVCCYENHADDSRVKDMGDSCQTLNSRMGTGGGNLPLVQEYYDWHSPNTQARRIEDNCSPTIPAAMGMGGTSMTTPMFIQESLFDAVGVDQYNMSSSLGTNCGMSTGRNAVQVVHGAETPISSEDCGHPLTCNHNGLENCVAIAENIIGRKVENGGNGVGAQEELAYTQNASGVMGVCTSTVRRLLPIECERLMGFPDNHTRIEWNGKSAEDCPDAPRYKAAGNSMCVNVMRWIGMQIDRVDKMEIAEK